MKASAPPAQPAQHAAPATAPATADAGQEVYGPYVPYQPPAPVAVQLGTSVPSKAMTQPQVTDVIPTARPLPNAHVRKPVGSHPDVAAANAAAIRRQQSTPPENVSADNALRGRSNPPAEDYSSAPLEPAEYKPASAMQPPPVPQPGQQQVVQQQVPQPAASDRQAATSERQAATERQASQRQPALIPQPGSSSVITQGADDSAQQYPQPGSNAPMDRSADRSIARARGRVRSRRSSPAVAANQQGSSAPMQQSAPSLSYPGISQPLTYQPYPTAGEPYALGTPPTDEDLMARRLPPLRGRYYRGEMKSPEVPLTQRQQAELDLAILEGSYSSWLGGTASARYRSGTAGVDRLTDLETSFEASAVLGDNVRLSIIPKAVFLNSGVLDTTAATTTNPVLGTLAGNAANPPQQQFASGVGGEIQLTTTHFAAAVGYTPYDFLVRNVTGRVLFRPNNRLTFYGDRSPVTETQLSYAGLRDPGQASLFSGGPVWGGVIATGGGIRYDQGDDRAGFYLTADGADLSGYHVLQNYKFEGSAGAYFLAKTFPGYGRLNVGGSLFGMHYNYNERGQTYGLGGYFSPQAYFLASVPVTFTGQYGSNFHYAVAGSVGVQTFQENSQNYFPLDRAQQAGVVCTLGQQVTGACRFAANSNTGGNYSINSEGAYRVADHWYAGGFASANNTNNYNTVTGGFFIRYLFRPQYATDAYPTGLFPVDGFRPLRVP